MKLSSQLDIRQSQTLVMTPQLQQAIHLLQLSSLDLMAYLSQEVEQNPLLTLEDPHVCALETPSVGEVDLDEAWTGNSAFDQELRYKVTPVEDGQSDIPEVQPDLRQHLSSQIGVDFTPGQEQFLAHYLIDHLDESGYFCGDVAHIAAHLGTPAETVEAVLLRLQKLEPAGIFARSLAECLRLQLVDRGVYTRVFEIILDNLVLVASKSHTQLAKKCNITIVDLETHLKTLKNLDPKPALKFRHILSPTLIPDVIMRPGANGWSVEINRQSLPKVYVDSAYYQTLRPMTHNKEERSFLLEKYNAGHWLVKALQQRVETILKVAQAIVSEQSLFFSLGIDHLKPLTLRVIAEATGMHESTISRVTNNKYMATPRGIFELKYFFSSSVKSQTTYEGTMASEAVRARIKTLVDTENKRKPLSDQAIAAALENQGITVARRTIAKYREALRILPAHQRRIR